MIHGQLTAAFILGAVVGHLLLFQYGFRSKWRTSAAGWTMMSLFAVIAVSYDLSVAALLWPDWFHDSAGLIIRVVARWLIDAALIALYVLVVRAQRADRTARKVTPPGGARQPIE